MGGVSDILIELDDRGRAVLTGHGVRPRDRYLADFLPDGSIHLTPAVVMTAAEAAMLRHHPQVAAHLTEGSFDGEEIDLDASYRRAEPARLRPITITSSSGGCWPSI